MLDRSIAPEFHTIQSITLPAIEKAQFSNGSDLYIAGFGTQDVLRVELVFDAGYGYADHKGFKSLFSKMLLGGTTSKTATQVAEEFSLYGGFIEVSQQVDRLYLTIHGLNRNLKMYLETVVDILTNASFVQEELETQRKIAKQTLQLNLEKPSYLANRIYREKLFGKDHLLGQNDEMEDLDLISQANLKEFYETRIKGCQFSIFASGKVSDTEIKTIESVFGTLNLQDTEALPLEFNTLVPETTVIKKTDSMQSTIRMGKFMLGRKHPDFFRLMVCNTAFGGYFGSRLMKNIREEKGFTYGISSSISPVRETGYLTIGTDVVKENTKETLHEIQKEIKLLQNSLITEGELELVKNYMCGSFAGSVTTAFEVMNRQKSIVLNDLPLDYYDKFIQNVLAVTTLDVQEMANRHLNFDEMTKVIVGEVI